MVILLAAVALWIQYLISPPPPATVTLHQPMPLWGYFATLMAGVPLLGVLFSLLLVLAIALVMIRFNVAIFFIPRRTFLPALLFIVLYSLFPGMMVLNPALPATFLILVSLWRMVSSYRVNGISFNFFDAALMISSAGLIYAGALWFLPLVVIAALVLRTPDTRELLLALAGALLPWVVLYAVWYVTGGDLSGLTAIITANLLAPAPEVVWSRTQLILLIVAALNVLPSMVYLFRILPTCKIRSRKSWEIMLWMTLIAVTASLLVPAVSTEMAAIAVLPLSFIMSGYLTFTKRVVAAETLFWIMAVMLVVVRLWP